MLNQLVCTKVNLDELDYLAKRLDSFDVGESSQFQVDVYKRQSEWKSSGII